MQTLLRALLVNLVLFTATHAWTPISGQSTFSTSVKLQQSHPEFDSSKVLGLNAQEIVKIPSTNLQERFEYNYGEQQDIGEGLFGEDHCVVKKYAFNHDGIVQYNNELPELSQFTICFWMRFTNHSADHVPLTYSVKNETREIQFWIANARNSSFISMAIKGQQMYRLNYPLRVRQWHHTCTSWNGKTGEWQVWLKAERIGRGFHNSLVGHKIPANGKLYSGGPSVTGEVSQGLHFEMTFVQIYRIALSAGKAHRDHKHHHVHHFDHEGQELATTTKAPPPVNRPLPMHSLLANGQIPTRLRINLAQPVQQPPVPQATQTQNFPPSDNSVLLGETLPDQHAFTINTNFVNGQIHAGSRLLAQQLIGLPRPQIHQAQTTHEFNTRNNPANVKFVDETETRIFFKRHAKQNETAAESKTRSKRSKTLQKRGLVLLDDGSVVDDSFVDYKYDGLAEFGDQQFKNGLTAKLNIEDEVAQHDREPAEEEVKAVMALCGGCDVEPFQGAIVFAWKDANEELDNALRGYSVGRCGDF